MKEESRPHSKPEVRAEPQSWKYSSPLEPGLHVVVSPENSPCRTVRMYRLNLPVAGCQRLGEAEFELVAGMVAGEVELSIAGQTVRLSKHDAFYLPGGQRAELRVAADAVLYIGTAPYEGVGTVYVRRYEPSLPLGPVRQIHGRPPYQRDVFMALGPDVPASRLIAGWTWSQPGAWTSWPPHQHEQDLEEVYGYFDMPQPLFGLHLSYCRPGEPAAVHVVSSGDFVVIPRGYHPTVAIPGVRNSYFWVMAAHTHASRRYDLSVPDPTMPV